MLYVPLAAVIYLALLFPRFFSPSFCFPALVLAFFLIFENERLRFRAILFAAVLFAAGEGVELHHVSLPLETGTITGITGSSSSEPSVKEDGMQFFYLELSSIKTGHGVHASASGTVGVLGPYNPVGTGDFVRAEGCFAEDGFFLASHVWSGRRSAAERIRKEARFFLSSRLAGLDEDGMELFRLLFFGSGYDPSYHIVENGRNKGVSHVFALSGMHLSILSTFVVYPLSFLLGRRRARLLSVPVLFLFTWLSSFRASLFRAFCFRLVLLLFPNADPDEAVCLSFVILALLFPGTLFTASSVYSFLSLSGMFFFSRLERQPFLRLLKPVLQGAGALSFSVPYSLMLFGSFSIAGLVFSCPVTFLVTVFMGLCMLSLLVPPLSFLAGCPYEALVFVLERIPSPAPTDDVGLYAALVLVLSYLLLAVHVAKPERNPLS